MSTVNAVAAEPLCRSLPKRLLLDIWQATQLSSYWCVLMPWSLFRVGGA